MKRPSESDYTSHVAYTRALEEYCDSLPQLAQEPVAWPTVDEFAQHIRWLNGSHKMGAGALAESLLEWLRNKILYTAPSPPAAQREWVGLTDEEKLTVRRMPWETLGDLMDNTEAKLKEKNNGFA